MSSLHHRTNSLDKGMHHRTNSFEKDTERAYRGNSINPISGIANHINHGSINNMNSLDNIAGMNMNSMNNRNNVQGHGLGRDAGMPSLTPEPKNNRRRPEDSDDEFEDEFEDLVLAEDDEIQEFIPSNSSSVETGPDGSGGVIGYSSPSSTKSQSSMVRTPSNSLMRSNSGGQRTLAFGSRPQSMEQGSTSSLYIKRQPIRGATQSIHQQQNKISALSPETPHTSYNNTSTYQGFQSPKNNSNAPNVYDHSGQKNISQKHLHLDDADIKPLMSSPSSSSMSGTRSRSGSARSRPIIPSKMSTGPVSSSNSVGTNGFGTISQPAHSTPQSSNYNASHYLKVDSSGDTELHLSHDSVPTEYSDEDVGVARKLKNNTQPRGPTPPNVLEHGGRKRTPEEMSRNSNIDRHSHTSNTDAGHNPHLESQRDRPRQFDSHRDGSSQPSPSFSSRTPLSTSSRGDDSFFQTHSPDSPRSILIRKKNPAIKNYVMGDLLGQGANGRVFLSFNSDSGEFFAVKEITFGNMSPSVLDEKLQALQREISVMKALDHENIVRYYGAEKSGANLNIFLEYIAGGSLASLVNRYGRLSEEVCKKFTKQILLGLDYLHKNRIVHRDIKGANILINVDGIVKLADFGASRQIANIMSFTQEFQTLSGTPHFMAPEVILQTGHGRSADIWSVGCTVTEMCTGKPPFAEYKTVAAVMYHIASTDDLPKLPDFLSSEAKDFLQRCFVRDRTMRATAEELLRHPWLKDVETPLERKMANAGFPMDCPSINNLIIQYQQEEKAQLTKEATRPQSTDSQKSGASSHHRTSSRPSSGLQKTSTPVSDSQRTTTPSSTRSTGSIGPKAAHSENKNSSPKSKDQISKDDVPLPQVRVADSFEFKHIKQKRQDSFSSLNLSQDDLISARCEPESEVEYGSPRLGFDDHDEISNFLKRKSDIQNKSMMSMDLSMKDNSVITTPPREPTEERKRLSSRRKERSNNSAYDLSVETGEDFDFPVHHVTITHFASPPSEHYSSPNRTITPSPIRYEESLDEKKIATSNAQLHRIEMEQKKLEDKKKQLEQKNREFEEEQRRYLEEQLRLQEETENEQKDERPGSGLSGKSKPRRLVSGRKRSNSTNSAKGSSKSTQGPDSVPEREKSLDKETEKKLSEKDKVTHRSVSKSSKVGEKIVKPSSSDKPSRGTSDKSEKPRQSSRDNVSAQASQIRSKSSASTVAKSVKTSSLSISEKKPRSSSLIKNP